MLLFIRFRAKISGLLLVSLPSRLIAFEVNATTLASDEMKGSNELAFAPVPPLETEIRSVVPV